MRSFEPSPVWRMKKKRYDGHHTLCQFLRDIYRGTDNKEIKMKARLAMSAAKELHEKLKIHKNSTEKV